MRLGLIDLSKDGATASAAVPRRSRESKDTSQREVILDLSLGTARTL